MIQVNRNNFICWYDMIGLNPDFKDLGNFVNNSYQQKFGIGFMPVFTPNERYSLFVNTELPFLSSVWSMFNIQFAIYNHKNERVYGNTGIGRLLLQTGQYKLYQNFICPELPDGCYNFRFEDTVTRAPLLVSNTVQVLNDAYGITQFFQYRHRGNILGYNYDQMPEFYNGFRLPLNKIDYSYDYNIETYTNVSNEMQVRTLRASKKKVVTIESTFFDEFGHDAMSAAYSHSEIYINNKRFVPKSGYVVKTNVRDELCKGTIEMFETNEVLETFFAGQGGGHPTFDGNIKNNKLQIDVNFLNNG